MRQLASRDLTFTFSRDADNIFIFGPLKNGLDTGSQEGESSSSRLSQQ